jgi:hypothetical protein
MVAAHSTVAVVLCTPPLGLAKRSRAAPDVAPSSDARNGSAGELRGGRLVTQSASALERAGRDRSPEEPGRARTHRRYSVPRLW